MSATPKDPPPRDDLWRDLIWSAWFVGGVLLALAIAGWAAPLAR